jgi:hypothetical protein
MYEALGSISRTGKKKETNSIEKETHKHLAEI